MKKSSQWLTLSLAGVLLLSPDSLLIRLLNLSDFSLIFYRSYLPAVTLFIFILWFYKKNTIQAFLLIGVPGVIYATLYAVTHVCFVYSIQYTSVSNTLVIVASAPIFSAILSIIFLKEQPSLFTWLIIFIALVSMFIIGWGSYSTTGIFGDIMALIVAIAMGSGGVLVRYFKNIDLVPACFVGCILAGLYTLPFQIEFDLTSIQILYLSLMCFVILPIPFIIMTIAPKYTPAYQVSLVFLLESVLGSAWVWIVINEVPSLNTIIGGAILLSSVLIYMILETKK
tara:strand:+ start:886 stop:1734 length:849 start_codon:yes stop_codon:yes gene_type:complete